MYTPSVPKIIGTLPNIARFHHCFIVSPPLMVRILANYKNKKMKNEKEPYPKSF